MLLVGDPRQATYRTAPSRKNEKYSNGNFKLFLNDKKITNCEIDETTLQMSWRCPQDVCDLASKLYLKFPQFIGYKISKKRLLIIEYSEIVNFIDIYDFMQLRYDKREKRIFNSFPVMNMGESKGLEFENTIVYLTKNMTQWIENQNEDLPNETRAKFYVGLTRSRGMTLLVKNK